MLCARCTHDLSCTHIYIYTYQGSKFHLSVSPGQVDFPGTSGLLILLSVGQPGSRQAPSLVSARHILVSDFNCIPLIQSRQARQFLL